jgi:serine/threonine-protein kinase RsbW
MANGARSVTEGGLTRSDVSRAEPGGAPEVELDVPAEAEFVSIVRQFVASLASSRRQLPPERVHDLKLAVSEAATNAIEAYGPARAEKRVLVRWTEAADYVEVSVEDRGPGFDPETLPCHPPVTDPERLSFERGLGIPLIRSLVDTVTFDPSSRGTSVTMMMRCSPPPAS